MGFLDKFNYFHDTAMAAIDHQDFGSDNYQKPLRLFLEDLDNHSRFTAAGEQAQMGEIIGTLCGRLLAIDGFKRYPELQKKPPVKPLIITGMPRTGSITHIANKLLRGWNNFTK